MLPVSAAASIRLNAIKAVLHSEVYVILKDPESEAPSAQTAKKNKLRRIISDGFLFTSLHQFHARVLHFEVEFG